jgi:hypothetical protein
VVPKHPSEAKAQIYFLAFAARLKSCPFKAKTKASAKTEAGPSLRLKNGYVQDDA